MRDLELEAREIHLDARCAAAAPRPPGSHQDRDHAGQDIVRLERAACIDAKPWRRCLRIEIDDQYVFADAASACQIDSRGGLADAAF